MTVADLELAAGSPSAGRLAPLPPWAPDLLTQARAAAEDVDEAARIALTVGRLLPVPGRGETGVRWEVLAALAEANLIVARVVEAHTDALAIIAEAQPTGVPHDASSRLWGVFAAESPDQVLHATHHSDRAGHPGSATLSGIKPWCSLGDVLDSALVTASADGGRQLFRVDLGHPSVHAAPATGWVARGLRTVTSVPITFEQTPAVAVGPVGWYLSRPGFAWGGMGVAACWHGGSVALAAALRRVAGRREGELNALHLGTVDAAVHAAAAVLADAARLVDAGAADGAAGELLALRVRAIVADTAERVLHQVGHALGPAPLAFDAVHAARVADLGLYVRQHHGERDLAALGAALLAGSDPA